jgi:hypothetical protein
LLDRLSIGSAEVLTETDFRRCVKHERRYS